MANNKVQADQTGAQDQGSAIKGNKNVVNTGTTYNVSATTQPEQQISGDGNTVSRTIYNGLDAGGVGSLFDKIKGIVASQPSPVINVSGQPASTYSQVSAGTVNPDSGTLTTPPVTMAAPNVVKSGFFGLATWQLFAAALALAGILFLIFKRRKKA